MTDIEQYEPTSTAEAIAQIDAAHAALSLAETVEDVNRLRNMAEVAMAYVRRHDEAHTAILKAQEFMRDTERKLAYILEDMKAAGKVRRAGRPRKPVNDLQDSGEQPVNDLQVSARDIFGDPMVQRDALLFATVNDDEWEELKAAVLAEQGDLDRAHLRRVLRRTPAERRADNGNIPNVGTIVPKAIAALNAVADSLERFQAAEVEHEDRKEWKAEMRAALDRLTAWHKALGR